MTASSCWKMKQVVLFLLAMDAWRLGVEPARSGAIATSAIGSLAAGLLPDRPAFGGQVTNWVEIGHWPRAAELLFSEGVEVGSLGSLGCMSRLRPS